ncbi:Wzz/FepE/Etk N-terminal domain-containing protein [Isoptericola sp. G70]|uniref:Wzz/FepE/Etk N-terminal domain-containing protein n=1 Tax=Isoptericola sp. G70 TaxID=3376633 RepID=UPI003A805A92
MTVREFLQVVWAGKYYVLVAVLLVVGGAYVYLDRLQPVYESTAVVQINGVDSVTGENTAIPPLSDVDPQIVTSDPVAQAAADELGFDGPPEALAPAVGAVYNQDLRTVSVTAEAGSPQAAQDLADAFATAYIGYLPTLIDDQVAALDERRDALRSQLEDVQKELRQDEDDPLATAEQESIVAQYQAISAQRSTLESISEPGTMLTEAGTAVALGLPRSSILGLAVLLGLVAGVGLAFARRGLDFHVRSAEEAVEVSEVNVLAELYGVKAAAKHAGAIRQLPITARAASPFTESIRELRTASRVSLGADHHSVVVVTAADPAAPRSFIAANLAASWALSGQRTIAFSADMRQPQLDEWLPAPAGWTGPAHELRPTTVPNLELQPVPDTGMDPADYLATTEVQELVAALRQRADVVVVDAPPVLAAADATILGSYSDGVVILASAGRTDRVVLAEAVQRLRINDVPISGLALSGVRGDRRTQYASVYGDEEQRAVVSADDGPAAPADPPGRVGADGRSASSSASAVSVASAASAAEPSPNRSEPALPVTIPPAGAVPPDPRKPGAARRHAPGQPKPAWRPFREVSPSAEE